MRRRDVVTRFAVGGAAVLGAQLRRARAPRPCSSSRSPAPICTSRSSGSQRSIELFPLDGRSAIEGVEYNRVMAEHADALRDFTMAHYRGGPGAAR